MLAHVGQFGVSVKFQLQSIACLLKYYVQLKVAAPFRAVFTEETRAEFAALWKGPSSIERTFLSWCFTHCSLPANGEFGP